MNILLLAHRVPYPPNKGEKIRTFHQLSHLLDKGHNVVVAAPLENQQEKQFAIDLQIKLNSQVQHSFLSMRWLRFATGLLKGKPISVTNFQSAKLQRQVDELIDTDTYDALMCTSSAMADYVLNKNTFSKIQKKGIRLVIDFMDLDSLKWQQYSEQKPWPLSAVYRREAKLLSKVESNAITTFDASVFVSEDEKSLAPNIDTHNSKIHVITNGVDTDTYYPKAIGDDQPSNTAPTFLFTGVMDYFPNENAVIWFSENVWPDIIKKYSQAKFIIAGMQPSKGVSALDQNKGIVVTGYVDDILPYYQDADIMVAPFRVARGIQNKVLQALASGLPVITSTDGAEGISCTDGEHLMVANSAQDYLLAIDQLLNDKEKYRNLRQAGLDLVKQKYCWEIENSKLEAILEHSVQS